MELIKHNQKSLKKIEMELSLPLTDLGKKMVHLINTGNSIELSRFKVDMTVEKAVKEGNLIQAAYKKNAEETIGLLSYLIIDFARSLNIGKNISNSQVDEIACMICSRFHDLRIEELVIILTNAKAGIYGKMYDRLDIMVFTDFILKYYSTQKADYLEKSNHYTSYKSISLLEAIINSDGNENPVIKKAQLGLKNFLTGTTEREDIKYTATAAIPKHSEYVEKAKKLCPEFTVKQLTEFKKSAIQANWKELIDIIEKEENRRTLLEELKSIESKISELEDKIKYVQMNQVEFEECVDERKEIIKEYNRLNTFEKEYGEELDDFLEKYNNTDTLNTYYNIVQSLS